MGCNRLGIETSTFRQGGVDWSLTRSHKSTCPRVRSPAPPPWRVNLHGLQARPGKTLAPNKVGFDYSALRQARVAKWDGSWFTPSHEQVRSLSRVPCSQSQDDRLSSDVLSTSGGGFDSSCEHSAEIAQWQCPCFVNKSSGFDSLSRLHASRAGAQSPLLTEIGRVRILGEAPHAGRERWPLACLVSRSVQSSILWFGSNCDCRKTALPLASTQKLGVRFSSVAPNRYLNIEAIMLLS